MQKTRNGFLDLIKIIATVLIIFHHFQQWLNVRFTLINFFDGNFYLGNLVELFFIISGFVITSYIPRIPKDISLVKFITRRYLRLIPIVALSTICDFFIKLFIDWTVFVEDPFIVIFETFSVSVGFQRLISTKATFANNPMWYVSILILCYMLFYFCFFLSNKVFVSIRVMKWIIPFVFMLGGALIILSSIDYPFVNLFIGRGLLSFFAGVIVGLIISKNKIPDKVVIPVSGLCFLVSIIPLCCNSRCSYRYVTFIYIPFCFAQIIFFSKTKTSEKVFNKGLFSSLSKVSFHAYCFHVPIMNIFGLFFVHDSFRNAVFSFPLLFMIVFVVIVYIFSCLSYRFIEKPIVLFLNKKGL